jgi:hypothetical protein
VPFGKSVREKVSVMGGTGESGCSSADLQGRKKSFPILFGKLFSFSEPVRDQAA